MKQLILITLLFAAIAVKAQKTDVLIAIEVPTDKLVEFRDLFCIEFNRPDSVRVNGILVINPETKNQFVRRKTGEFITEWYRNVYHARKAHEELKRVNTTIDITPTSK